jgi:hypothetical protein
MEKIVVKLTEQNVTEDVICDCCGNSCKTEYGIESMKISATWGFMSNKDGEKWQADLCEKCVDEKLSFINFNVKKYF